MKIKLLILVTSIAVTVLMAAGCSGSAISTASAGSGLSTATRLAVGTLKLEGTSQAVTASQAKELLILWEAYQSMSSSETTAQVEVEALVSQIESALTAEQVQAIEAMDLTTQSVSEVAQPAAVASANSTSGNSVSASGSTSSSASSSVAPSDGSGGAPGGGMPMNSNPLADVTGGTSAQSTPSATQQTNTVSTTQVDPMVLQALIRLLQTRSSTAG